MSSYTYLLTGGAGYLGSFLANELLNNGHNVIIIDNFYFETEFNIHKNLTLIKKDVRNIQENDFRNVDIVIDLAAISNDPAADLNQEFTYKINGESRLNTCKLAKASGVKGYILASSCSVYGFNNNLVNETSEVQPLTTYAYANLLAEKLVTTYASEDFSVLVFRQATLFGISSRMRFDLVINGMTYSGIKNNKINILRDGNQKRPLLSLQELSKRFLSIDENVFKKNNNQIFNIGNNKLNLSIIKIYELVNEVLGGNLEKNWYGEPDFRSYEVDFSKAAECLPKIQEADTLEEINKIKDFVTDGNFNYDKCITLTWYKKLLEQNSDLFNKF